IFTGRNNQALRRRALVRFPMAGLPAGAVVSSATLTLRSTTSGGATDVNVHRVLADWGEGTSNAAGSEGAGAAATSGDATWLHRFYNTLLWSAPGGQYQGTPSATASVAAQNPYAWSGPGMVTDVQAWLDGVATNFGWVLVGVENAGNTEKRYASRQYAADTSYRPRLTITYTVPPPDPTGACCLDDGTCDEQTETACQSLGGHWQGEGTACHPEGCPVVLTPFVDALTVPPVAVPISGTVGGIATYDMRMVEFRKKLHRDLPPTTVWGYEGHYPGPTIVATRGLPVTVNWINDLRDSTGALRTTHYLPVDQCLHGPDTAGTGARVVVHLHGGHVPQSVDGHPDSTFLPGESRTYTYPNNQAAALIWYHDHALGTTRLNVMMGLAGGYVVTDPVEGALSLPGGAYDLPIIIQDRRFHADGSLSYPAIWEEHFFGDVALVNGTVWPFAEVRRGAYRLRLLNGSNSRTYILRLSNGLPFTVIGGDAGLLERPVRRDSLLITPGERIDTIVDFSGVAAGTGIILTNSAPAPYPIGDPMHPALPAIMKFVVRPEAGYAWTPPGILRPPSALDPATADMARDFSLEKMADDCTGQMWTINGLHWDDITELPRLGDTEVWRFINRSGVVHPMHLHLVHFQVLDRAPFDVVADTLVFGTPVTPDSALGGWKDTVPVLPGEAVRVIARFDDYTGRYPYHCHVLEHEDHEMMRQFEVVDTLVTGLPETPVVPVPMRLEPGYPNPMTGVTRIAYEVPREAFVSLRLFDVAGRQVATLDEGIRAAGRHVVVWEGRATDGARLASGLYFYRLTVDGSGDLSRKLLVLE
ncbi:MAG TPA: multicopper oxidase domain-containing protein, partial [Candidatus Eisenbacteria bacterium]